MLLYRLLLRLYPASFRREYERELRATFAGELRDARGPGALVGLWLSTIADVVTNAARTHADILGQDVRQNLRALRRTPAFAASFVVAGALGVGVTTAALSVADFVLVRPLPFREQHRLVNLWHTTPRYSTLELSAPNFRDWKAASTSFSAMEAWFGMAANMVGSGEPRRVRGTRVTSGLIDMLGVAPLRGRAFTASDGEEDAPGTLVLSYAFWRGAFGGDEAAIGRVVTLDGQPHEIIGVMPRGFQYPDRANQFWLPVALTPVLFPGRGDFSLNAIARLNDGVSLEQARTESSVIASRLAREYPESNREVGVVVRPIRDDLNRNARVLLLALAGASVCILLIACANIGNLLLARGAARRHEMAVREALGAGRERLARQLVTDALALSGASVALGAGLAFAALPLLARLVPEALPMDGVPGVNLLALGGAAGVLVANALAFSAVPLVGSPAASLRDDARSGGGRRGRLRGVLVASEISVSVALLATAGLLMQAIVRIQETDPGFRAEHAVVMRTALSPERYAPVAERHRYYAQVADRIEELPGVTAAGFTSFLPMVMGGGLWPVAREGERVAQDGSAMASMRFITPGYFAAMGVPLLEGRDVMDRDAQSAAPVAVVSRSLADRLWPREHAVGRRFAAGYGERPQVREVIGVVGDMRVRGLERPSEPQMYFPEQQAPDGAYQFYWPKDLVVRTTTPVWSLVPAIRAIIRDVDADQPISNVRTLSDVVAEQTASRTTLLRVLGALAAAAFLLAGIGIQGLTAFTVSQRAREFAVRMALGARGGDVVRMVIGGGLALMVTGLVPGIALAWIAGRAMQSVLFGVPAGNLLLIAAVSLLCVAMTVIGCLGPALRAIRIDPMEVMRAE